MKFRKGFVSNSSTTSFVVVGIAVDCYEALELILEPSVIEEQKKIFGDDIEDDYSEIIEEIIPWNNKSDIETHHMEYEGTIIGTSLLNIGEDETLRDLKNRVVAELNKLGFICSYKDMSLYEHCGYDG